MNSLMTLILSLEPKQTSRENLHIIRSEFKALTSRSLFYFQDSLNTMEVIQVSILDIFLLWNILICYSDSHTSVNSGAGPRGLGAEAPLP